MYLVIYMLIYLDKLFLVIFKTLKFSYECVDELIGAVLGLNFNEADLLDKLTCKHVNIHWLLNKINGKVHDTVNIVMQRGDENYQEKQLYRGI